MECFKVLFYSVRFLNVFFITSAFLRDLLKLFVLIYPRFLRKSDSLFGG